jgi:hypothetical protein
MLQSWAIIAHTFWLRSAMFVQATTARSRKYILPREPKYTAESGRMAMLGQKQLAGGRGCEEWGLFAGRYPVRHL